MCVVDGVCGVYVCGVVRGVVRGVVCVFVCEHAHTCRRVYWAGREFLNFFIEDHLWSSLTDCEIG